MKKLFTVSALIIVTAALMTVSCLPARTGEIQFDTFDFKALGLGINIGNTLDAIGTNTWHSGETGWGNPVITREFIKALKNHGFKTIRLPVTWAEYIGPAPNYRIASCVFPDCSGCPDRMDRVEEVVNWILEEGMYCILNLHHDGGNSDKSWILSMSTNEEETLRKFEAVWTQIVRRFRNASDKLILESMNEVGFDDIWNRRSGNQSQKNEAYRKLNALNQSFVNTVRASGGGNATRMLLIAGYWTDIDATCDPLFKMPDDRVNNRLLLSVHYYTPPQFAVADNPNTSWGFRDDWGTAATVSEDMAELTRQFDKLKVSFIDKGIPVILGEYGVTKRNKVEEGRIRWMTAVTQICLDYGICPVLWDTGINPAANNNSGEIQRVHPYAMTTTFRRVLDALIFP